MACDRDVLFDLATKFRTAIVACEPRSIIGSLANYPNGACVDASYLLARYLTEQGCGEFEYVVGTREQKSHTHAWLEQEGMIVDITADQFKGMSAGVFVSQNRSWHRQFIEDDRYLADYESHYRDTDKKIFEIMNNSYKVILAQIV